jgi:MFS transporter, MHS family, citrate/tricarballylate:H+ symporter
MDTNSTDEPTTSGLPVVRKSHVRRVLQVASGSFPESYDVVVFAYFAPSIGRAFFPSANELASLMATFMTFGAAYLIRPLGALLLGPYLDHYAGFRWPTAFPKRCSAASRP